MFICSYKMIKYIDENLIMHTFKKNDQHLICKPDQGVIKPPVICVTGYVCLNLVKKASDIHTDKETSNGVNIFHSWKTRTFFSVFKKKNTTTEH